VAAAILGVMIFIFIILFMCFIVNRVETRQQVQQQRQQLWAALDANPRLTSGYDTAQQLDLNRVLDESRKEYIKSFLSTKEASLAEINSTPDVVENVDADDCTFCSICLDEYASGDQISRAIHASTCHHFFHEHCITSWLMHHDNCPCCRVSYFVGTEEAK
jgi:hypothetical protein